MQRLRRVVFVRAFNQEPTDLSFPAAPAATAALHYHCPRASGANRSGSFWDFLNPGLGLHVAYLDLCTSGASTGKQDPSTEIGAGGTLQLFGDIVQGGIAYDLQAELLLHRLGTPDRNELRGLCDKRVSWLGVRDATRRDGRGREVTVDWATRGKRNAM
ncbi:MAG: hypothetical protein R3B07_11605 [Polyangiaceae bacterium]